jgi:hypothetical protein
MGGARGETPMAFKVTAIVAASKTTLMRVMRENFSKKCTGADAYRKSASVPYNAIIIAFGRAVVFIGRSVSIVNARGIFVQEIKKMKLSMIFAPLLIPALALAQSDDAVQKETNQEIFVGLQAMLLGIGLNTPGVEMGVALGNHVSLIGYAEANTLNLFSEPIEKSNGKFVTRYGTLGAGARYSPWAGSFFTEALLAVGVKQYYETLHTPGRNFASDFIRVQGNIGNKWNIYDFTLGMKWITIGYPIWEDIRVWRLSDYKANIFDAEAVRDMESQTLQLVSMFDVFVEYRF